MRCVVLGVVAVCAAACSQCLIALPPPSIQVLVDVGEGVDELHELAIEQDGEVLVSCRVAFFAAADTDLNFWPCQGEGTTDGLRSDGDGDVTWMMVMSSPRRVQARPARFIHMVGDELIEARDGEIRWTKGKSCAGVRWHVEWLEG